MYTLHMYNSGVPDSCGGQLEIMAWNACAQVASVGIIQHARQAYVFCNERVLLYVIICGAGDTEDGVLEKEAVERIDVVDGALRIFAS